MCITEKKFKKTVGQLWLGNNDLTWLGDILDQVVKNGKSDEFFKHRRDGYKALHVIRRSNKHGMFLEISEFHSGSRQGVIRIPEGAERQGWVHLSKLCKGFMAPLVVPQRNIPIGRDMERRKGEVGVAGRDKEREAKEPRISQTYGKNGKNVINAMNLVEGNMAKDIINVPLHIQTKPTINARVELVLKLELVCGPNGHWDVSWAKVTNTTGGAQEKPHNPETHSDLGKSQLKVGQEARVPLKQIWRPKSGPSSLTGHHPSHVDSSLSTQSPGSLAKYPSIVRSPEPNPTELEHVERAIVASSSMIPQPSSSQK